MKQLYLFTFFLVFASRLTRIIQIVPSNVVFGAIKCICNVKFLQPFLTLFSEISAKRPRHILQVLILKSGASGNCSY